MKVLVLSPHFNEVAQIVYDAGDEASVDSVDCQACLMYCYRHILKQDEIDRFPYGVYNLHTSLLPWNRGAHPNFWSWFDRTPKGVTLHRVDKGIDTGPVIANMHTPFRIQHTLKSSYDSLHRWALQLLKQEWAGIATKTAVIQPHKGTYHRTSDITPYFSQLSAGWDTPTEEVVELGKRSRQ